MYRDHYQWMAKGNWPAYFKHQYNLENPDIAVCEHSGCGKRAIAEILNVDNGKSVCLCLDHAYGKYCITCGKAVDPDWMMCDNCLWDEGQRVYRESLENIDPVAYERLMYGHLTIIDVASAEIERARKAVEELGESLRIPTAPVRWAFTEPTEDRWAAPYFRHSGLAHDDPDDDAQDEDDLSGVGADYE